MGSSFWGTGVFAEGARLVVNFAVDVVGVQRLEARAAVANGRGNGALRKIGAVQEGVLRRSFLRNGQYHDQVLWSILAEDWRLQRMDARAVIVHYTPLSQYVKARTPPGGVRAVFLVTIVNVSDFDFHLPDELIAQDPPASAARRGCWCSTASGRVCASRVRRLAVAAANRRPAGRQRHARLSRAPAWTVACPAAAPRNASWCVRPATATNGSRWSTPVSGFAKARAWCSSLEGAA